MIKTYVLIGLLLLSNAAGWAQKKRASATTPTTIPAEESRKDYHAQSAPVINAVCERLAGNYSQAESILINTINQYPKYDLAHFEYAKILLLKNKTSKAIVELQTAVELNDTNDWYKALLAESLDMAYRYSESEALWKHLADHHPDNPEYVYKYSISLIYQNKFKEAVNAYNQIELLMGVSADISYAKRNIWLHLNKVDMAVKEMENLANAYPQEVQYLIEIADLYTNNNMPDKAIPYLNKAAELNPDNGKIHVSLYNYYIEKKQYTKAFEHLRQAYLDPNMDVDKKINTLINYYGHMEVKDTALILLHNLITAHPEEPKAWSIYGDFMAYYQMLDSAIYAYGKVLSMDQSKYSVWQAYIELLFVNGQYQQAYECSGNVIEMYPMQVAAYIIRGLSAVQLKFYPEARASFLEALNYTYDKEQKSDIYTHIAQVYGQEHNIDSAIAYYEKSLQCSPQDAHTLNEYSYALAEQDTNLNYALQMSQKSLEQEPLNAYYLDTYAWILFKMHDYANAKIWIEKSIKNQGSKNLEIMKHYAAILEQCHETKLLQQCNKIIEQLRNQKHNNVLP